MEVVVVAKIEIFARPNGILHPPSHTHTPTHHPGPNRIKGTSAFLYENIIDYTMKINGACIKAVGGKPPFIFLTRHFDMSGISEPNLLWNILCKFSWLSFDTKYDQFWSRDLVYQSAGIICIITKIPQHQLSSNFARSFLLIVKTRIKHFGSIPALLTSL